MRTITAVRNAIAINASAAPGDTAYRKGQAVMRARILPRGHLIATAAVIALALAAFMSPAAQAQSPNDPGLIVAARYSAANDGNPQIVAVNPRNGATRVLTSGSQDEVPDLSPDGRTVVFERCIKALDCDQAGKKNVWTMHADGSRAHPLTTCDGNRCLGAFDPAFSPDGRYIAFAQDLLDAKGVNFNGIFIMEADGTHARRLTSSGPDGFPEGQPQFSPDGRQLVFHREVGDGSLQLLTVRVDGTGLRELLPGVDGSAPSWSPDGKRIAFTLVRHDTDSTLVDVATVRPNGTDLAMVTKNPAESSSFAPDYAPNGSRVVFSQANSVGCNLVTMGSSGGDRRVLPSDGWLVDASWSTAATHH
jgi:Tol biopolymer transport system component